jgi:hypothetical protein
MRRSLAPSQVRRNVDIPQSSVADHTAVIPSLAIPVCLIGPLNRPSPPSGHGQVTEAIHVSATTLVLYPRQIINFISRNVTRMVLFKLYFDASELSSLRPYPHHFSPNGMYLFATVSPPTLLIWKQSVSLQNNTPPVMSVYFLSCAESSGFG